MRIEARHQPARRGRVHPGADIGGEARSPDDREGRVAKGSPSGSVRRGPAGRLVRAVEPRSSFDACSRPVGSMKYYNKNASTVLRLAPLTLLINLDQSPSDVGRDRVGGANEAGELFAALG